MDFEVQILNFLYKQNSSNMSDGSHRLWSNVEILNRIASFLPGSDLLGAFDKVSRKWRAACKSELALKTKVNFQSAYQLSEFCGDFQIPKRLSEECALNSFAFQDGFNFASVDVDDMAMISHFFLCFAERILKLECHASVDWSADAEPTGMLRLQQLFEELNPQCKISLHFTLAIETSEPYQLVDASPLLSVEYLDIQVIDGRFTNENQPVQFIPFAEMILNMFPNIKYLKLDASDESEDDIQKELWNPLINLLIIGPTRFLLLEGFESALCPMDLNSDDMLTQVSQFSVNLKELKITIYWSEVAAEMIEKILNRHSSTLKFLTILIYPISITGTHVPPLIFPRSMPKLQSLTLYFDAFHPIVGEPYDLSLPEVNYPIQFPALRMLSYNVDYDDVWLLLKMNGMFLPNSLPAEGPSLTVREVDFNFPPEVDQCKVFVNRVKKVFPHVKLPTNVIRIINGVEMYTPNGSFVLSE